MNEIDPGTLDFGASPEYVNRTRRFVLPVPDLGRGAEPLVVPAGDPREGQVLRRRAEGGPRGGAATGIVFFNAVDRAWQAALGDGSEAILVNAIDGHQAAALKAWLDARAPAPLDLAAIRAFLAHARDALGLVDVYHKRLASIRRDMAPAEPGGANPYDFIVTKQTRHRALRIDRPFTFDGPVRQHYPDGAVLVNDGRHTWGVATAVFLRCYRRVQGGREVALTAEAAR